ncbi:GNAT family N-acetyltransferase [Kutzneria buriramensis]|uniref:Ribosomal protein S18 acetylase RimI-like enzyme n=1 Tax=Kutzneria buriramensis TaxID=1045776 RepID=A0A3E0HFQ1_9PSEU|nr:GNAT family N-acetyltransferase [Kutzneria buriramensis]REH44549.1 ribosomal protein S18 acetylase RimI-like enzyme [Kutzneria buriramensis]
MGADVRLVEITDENREAVCALRVHPSQERFVGSVPSSLADAAKTPEAEPWYRAVCAGDEPVGFVMLSWNVPPGRPGIIGPYFLWRLLIDGRHQGRGYGRAALDAVVELIRADGAAELLTSHQPDGDGPGPFYHKYGFEPTGEVDNGEPVLRLRLTTRPGMRTTPPRPVDVAAVFPELAAYRRDAVRLHPRRGRPSAWESSMGGPMVWPAEPWPHCATHEAPLVPILQIFERQVPELPFPHGTDVLQVLWCAFDHPDTWTVRTEIFWRDSAGLGPVTPPMPLWADEDYLPAPCVLHPERVVDYPSWDLPSAVWDVLEPRLTQLEMETGWSYQHHLSVSPGVKVGGYPTWTQEADWPGCPGCSNPMAHLLTVGSAEFDGGSWQTWLPVEDTPASGTVLDLDLPARTASQSAPGLMLGDMGGVYLFECLTCPDRPFEQRFDCS